jgi:hypothetical protein
LHSVGVHTGTWVELARLTTWDNLLEWLLGEVASAEFPNFIKGEWLTVLNKPPATVTNWKWGLAQTTELM